MRTYVVRAGDTPASIASEDHHAGCPKCAVDLIKANPQKRAKRLPNGFLTFEELREGEILKLPSKWFDGGLDTRPRAYFAALPHPDGVTPGTVGSEGLLGDYATLDDASEKVLALGKMSDSDFPAAVNQAASLIDQTVREVDSHQNPAIVAYAQAAHSLASSARMHGLGMSSAQSMNDPAKAARERTAAQNDLLSAIDASRMAMAAVYGDPPPVVTPVPPPVYP